MAHLRVMVAVMAAIRVATLAIDGSGWATLSVGARQTQGIQMTVWDGVYTSDQAARGQVIYVSHCSSCHLADLSGSAEARPLVGDGFMLDWGEDNLNSLFNRVRTLMPFDDPATLEESDYLDSVAYILQANGFPPGSRELELAGLGDIRIQGQDGPGEVPSFALVRVMGCLSRAEDDSGWVLGRSTAAVRTDDPSESSGEELRLFSGQPLGSRTFMLMSVYPDPAQHVGHVVEAKGFLVRGEDGTADRINVSTLGVVASTCELQP